MTGKRALYRRKLCTKPPCSVLYLVGIYKTDNMVNLYAFYVLEIALRIAVLEVIGVNVSDDVKNYVMDEHLDWIKLEKHLDEDCILPMNVFRQMIEKLQNQEKNP